MGAISGRTSRGSLASADLTLSLASRLQARTALLGSTLFALTWKQRVTPSGRSIPALRASAPRTSDSGCTSWGTPTVQDSRHATVSPSEMKRDPANLRIQVHQTGWPTQNTPGGGRSMDPSKMSATGKTLDGRKHTVSLEHVVRFATWATPTTADGNGAPLHAWTRKDGKARNDRQDFQAVGLVKDSGTTPTGSPASTEKRAQLNPAHSRWLMGLPGGWDECAPPVFKWQRKPRTEKTCENCGKLLSRLLNVYRRKDCGMDCMSEAFTKKPETKAAGRWQAQHLYPTKQCERCGVERDELHRHHRDQDPTNNEPQNIQVLCRACHNAVHRELAKAAADSTRSTS